MTSGEKVPTLSLLSGVPGGFLEIGAGCSVATEQPALAEVFDLTSLCVNWLKSLHFYTVVYLMANDSES